MIVCCKGPEFSTPNKSLSLHLRCDFTNTRTLFLISRLYQHYTLSISTHRPLAVTEGQKVRVRESLVQIKLVPVGVVVPAGPQDSSVGDAGHTGHRAQRMIEPSPVQNRIR